MLLNFVLFVGPFHPISSPSTLFTSLGVLPSAFFSFNSSSGLAQSYYFTLSLIWLLDLISFFFLSSCLLFHPSFSVTCSSCVCFSSVHNFFILHFPPFMPLCLCSSFLFMLHFLFSSCPLPALSLFLAVSNFLSLTSSFLVFFPFSLSLCSSFPHLFPSHLCPLAPLQMEVNFTRSREIGEE